MHIAFIILNREPNRFVSKLVQENQALAERIQQTVTNDEMKSMHDELSLLDEVRYVNNADTQFTPEFITYISSIYR